MSCSQEIRSIYDNLNRINSIDVENYVYGVDGFVYSVYPSDWNRTFSSLLKVTAPSNSSNINNRLGFCGDIVYCERLWNEFEQWLSKEKGIELVKLYDDYEF